MDGNAAAATVPTLLEQMQSATSIAEFDVVEASLADMEAKYRGLVYSDIQTKEGLAKAKADRAEIREIRFGVANKAKGLKDPINKFKKLIDEQAERIIERVQDVEDPIDAQIKAEEARLEAVKEAKRQAEAKRIEGLNQKIAGIRELGNNLIGLKPDEIATRLETARALEISLETLEEKAGEGAQAQAEVIRALETAHAAAVQAEETRKELEALRAERAEREAKEAAEKAEREAKEAAEKAEREAKEAAEKAAREAAEKAEKAEREAREAAERAEESRRLQKERDELAQAQAELDRQRQELQAELSQMQPSLQKKIGEAVLASTDAAIQNAADLEAALVPSEPIEPRPTDLEIVSVLAEHYGVSKQAALDWLFTVDFHALQAAL